MHMLITPDSSDRTDAIAERETYTLRFPFQLAPGQELSSLEQTIEQTIGHLILRFKRQEPYYVFEVDGFDAEDSARSYLSQMWTGLMWVLLNRGFAFTAVLDFDRVFYPKDPQKAAENLAKSFGQTIKGKVDGLANGNLPAVYSSDKQIRTITAGQVNLTTGMPAEQFVSFVIEGISISNGSSVFHNPKLRTALELYSAYFSEQSSNARLLTLVMALEALSTRQPKHPVARKLLDEWHGQLRNVRAELPSRTEEYEALESLERELLFRREASLRSQIRTLVYDTLVTDGKPRALELARRAVEIYDSRSRLVHEGTLPPDELRNAGRDAREIVVMVLKAKLRQLVPQDS